MKSFVSAPELGGASGTDGGCEGQNVINVDDARLADAEEAIWQDGLEFVEAIFDAIDVVASVGVSIVVAGFEEQNLVWVEKELFVLSIVGDFCHDLI